MAERFPWGRLMALGMGTLHMPPEQFWRCTLKEVVAALGANTTARPMARNTLAQLMEQFPDGPDAD